MVGWKGCNITVDPASTTKGRGKRTSVRDCEFYSEKARKGRKDRQGSAYLYKSNIGKEEVTKKSYDWPSRAFAEN